MNTADYEELFEDIILPKDVRKRLDSIHTNLREDYWLYAVYNCATPIPQMIRVQDPFHKLLVRPFTKTQKVERTIRATVKMGGVRVGHAQVMEAGDV